MYTLRRLIVVTLLGIWSFPAVGLARPVSEAGTPAAESTRVPSAAPTSTERSEASTSEAQDLQAREKQAPDLQDYRGGGVYIGGAALVLLIVLLVLLV